MPYGKRVKMRKTLILLESFPHVIPPTLSSLLSCYIRDQWRPEAPALVVVQGWWWWLSSSSWLTETWSRPIMGGLEVTLHSELLRGVTKCYIQLTGYWNKRNRFKFIKTQFRPSSVVLAYSYINSFLCRVLFLNMKYPMTPMLPLWPLKGNINVHLTPQISHCVVRSESGGGWPTGLLISEMLRCWLPAVGESDPAGERRPTWQDTRSHAVSRQTRGKL